MNWRENQYKHTFEMLNQHVPWITLARSFLGGKSDMKSWKKNTYFSQEETPW